MAAHIQPNSTFDNCICCSQPSVRGVLIGLSNLANTGGVFLILLLANLMSWRNVALICIIVPVITHVAICFVSICIAAAALPQNKTHSFPFSF